MTIKTLTYIHNLLIDKEKVTNSAKELARKNLINAEENELPNLKSFENLYQKTYNSWLEASRALDEFEQHEFR